MRTSFPKKKKKSDENLLKKQSDEGKKKNRKSDKKNVAFMTWKENTNWFNLEFLYFLGVDRIKNAGQ